MFIQLIRVLCLGILTLCTSGAWADPPAPTVTSTAEESALPAALPAAAAVAASPAPTEPQLTTLDKISAGDTAFVDQVLDTIIAVAKTDKVGDGKIFVTNILQVVRIRTGQTGSDAL